MADVLAVDSDAAGGDLIEAGNQLAQGGFSPTGGACKGELFPGVNGQVDIPEDLRLVVVVEGDRVKLDISPHLPQLLGVG